MYHESNYIQRNSVDCESIYVLAADSCVRETFRKFLTWAESETKNGVFPVSCSQPAGKFCCKPILPTGKRTLPGGVFCGSTHPDINNPKRDNPEFSSSGIHFIHPIDVDNFVEFDGEITFKSEQKLRRYRQKTPCTGGSTTNENDYRQKPAFYGIAMSK